jgi:hypothetical protein
MFPVINSPCPLKSIQLSQSGNFNCSSCKREVHNLSAMTEQERHDFLLQCEGKICVSYSVKHHVRKVAIAGLFAVTASGMALPIAAQTADDLESEFYDLVVVGGVDNPKLQALESTDEEAAEKEDTLPLIPVVEDDDTATTGN